MRKKVVRYGVWGLRLRLSVLSCQPSASRFPHFALRLFFLFFALFLLPHTLFAQSVSATIDRSKILLGEQITLELKIRNIVPQSAPVASWFSLPDTINHIEVVNRLPIDTIAVNGTISYIQNITITSFDSGNWQLPPLLVVLQKEENKTDTLRTGELMIEVLPVDVSDMQQYHQMKDIVDVDAAPDYLLIAAIILSVLLAAFAIWHFFIRKKKNKMPALKPVAERSLFETAIEQLEKLLKDNPAAPQFYIRLDEICRNFFQNQLHILASHLTNDELMVQLHVYMQPEARTLFYQLLRLVSAVKFARYMPEEPQKAIDVNTAKEAVQHIYYHLQRNLAQHAT